MFNRSGDSGHPSVPDLGEKAFSFPPLNMRSAGGLPYINFIMLGTFPVYPIIAGFCPVRMLDFVVCFSCMYWDDHMVFILHFVNGVYLINVEMLGHP